MATEKPLCWPALLVVAAALALSARYGWTRLRQSHSEPDSAPPSAAPDTPALHELQPFGSRSPESDGAGSPTVSSEEDASATPREALGELLNMVGELDAQLARLRNQLEVEAAGTSPATPRK